MTNSVMRELHDELKRIDNLSNLIDKIHDAFECDEELGNNGEPIVELNEDDLYERDGCDQWHSHQEDCICEERDKEENGVA